MKRMQCEMFTFTNVNRSAEVKTACPIDFQWDSNFRKEEVRLVAPPWAVASIQFRPSIDLNGLLIGFYGFKMDLGGRNANIRISQED